MDRWLNKIAIAVTMLICCDAVAQMQYGAYGKDDYKNKDQFEKFQKRRKVIGAWQVNELKTGALIVKLKTNNKLVEELIRSGKKDLADEKKLETYFINKHIMQAFKDHFDFCKVYFVYSYSGDSLMKGVRKGIFLDSTLAVNPSIELTEKYFLVAERDYVYNSSIGFVPEDSARYVKEQGNPSGEQAAAVIKNKYGHQLKKPFPYICGYGNKGVADMTFVKKIPVYYSVSENGLVYNIDKTQLRDMKNSASREFKKAPAGAQTFMLDKEYAYEVLSSKVSNYAEDLNSYYKGSPKPQIDKLDKDVLPFLY